MATFPANCEFPARVVAIDVGGTKITGSIVRYDSAEAEPVVEDSRTVATEALKGGASVLDQDLLARLRPRRVRPLLPSRHRSGNRWTRRREVGRYRLRERPHARLGRTAARISIA